MTTQSNQNVSGFALLCDLNGVIKTIIHADCEAFNSLVGQAFISVVGHESHLVWSTLIQADAGTGEETFSWRGLVIRVAGKEYTGFAGVDLDRNILVVGFQEHEEMVSLYEELIRINSQLTNGVRSLYKDRAQNNMELYDEISKINNELTNARRTLQKQNRELEALNDKLEELSVRDPLTGLFNRRYFFIQTPQVAARLKRGGGPICLVMIDINDFKRVNDQFGHDAGDHLLIHLSQCLEEVIRKGQDMAFRFGGDEFLVLLEQSSGETAMKVMERICIRYDKQAEGTTLSYGIEVIDTEEIEIDFSEAIKRADEKMYKDKAAKKAMSKGKSSH